MKRSLTTGESDFTSLFAIEEDLVYAIVKFKYTNYETDPKEFRALTRMRGVSKAMERIVGKLYKNAIRIPRHYEGFFGDEKLGWFPKLESLELWGDRSTITDEGLRGATNLTELHLGYTKRITYTSLLNLTNLTKLSLNNNPSIVNYALLPLNKLQTLSIARNNLITDDGLRLLSNLTSLNLSFNKIITNEGISGLTNLTSLDIENTYIGNDGLRYLTNLTNLELRQNRFVTDEGLAALVNLRRLDLEGNQEISSIGMSWLPRLKEIVCYYGGVTNDYREIDNVLT